MSLEKSIQSGREWRKKPRGCHRFCEWCISNRVHRNIKRLYSVNEQIQEMV